MLMNQANIVRRGGRATTCEHLENLKMTAGGLKNYAKIHVNLITCLVERSRDLRIRLGKCFTCRKVDGFVHSCLTCIFFGCLKSGHLRMHYKETNHPLVCDILFGTVYCFKCADYLFDRDFEMIALSNERKAEWMMWLPWTSRSHSRFADLFPKSHPPKNKRMCLSSKSTFGLRGLVNLGHTCFMNCIIQALLHTPVLRDFFLTEKITCGEKHDRLKPCIITQFFELYQLFYDGSKNPLSLHQLLHKIWGNAAHLASYEQQDAHEFFIAILEALHMHFAPAEANIGCNCIIDAMFLGKLQSSVTCTVCGHKSVTVDPLWDVSVDLVVNPDDPNGRIDLDDVLARYTRVEHLGTSGMIWCSHCLNNQESTKQLLFKVLPIILCFHLKRFEHSTNYKKIDNCVRFPEHLDLVKYTADYEPRKVPIEEQLFNRIKQADYRYSLYAVVNHVGSLEGGHYFAYIRHTRDDWYKCDDHMITKVDIGQVVSSPGYLLFYHKDCLLYDENGKTQGSLALM